MQFRNIVVPFLLLATLMLLIGRLYTESAFLVEGAILTCFLALLIFMFQDRLVKLIRPHLILILYSLATGMILAMISELMVRLGNLISPSISAAIQVLVFPTELAIGITVSLLFMAGAALLLFILLFPSVAVVTGEKLFHKKSLWMSYLVEISFVYILALMANWQAVVSSLGRIIELAFYGLLLGGLSFVLATRLAGFEVKDYSYLKFSLSASLRSTASLFRRADLFAHLYRPPMIESENPLMVTIKLLPARGAYTARIHASQSNSTTDLSIIAFQRRTEFGKTYRNAVTDAICKDILAVLSVELGCIPSGVSGPSSRPLTINQAFESFALRETKENLSGIMTRLIRGVSARKQTLTKLGLVIAGSLLLLFTRLSPDQPMIVWLVGVALPIITFIWQVYDWISKRL